MQKDHLRNEVLGISSSQQQRRYPKFYSELLLSNSTKQATKKRSMIKSKVTNRTSNYLDFYLSLTKAINLRNNATVQKNSSINTGSQSLIEGSEFLNNCTLILLNTYLLAYKTQCDNEGFVDSLSHYDCMSTVFSVKSNCKLCEVSCGTV